MWSVYSGINEFCPWWLWVIWVWRLKGKPCDSQVLITTVLTLKAFGSWERSQQPFPSYAILGYRDGPGATDAFCSCRGPQIGFFQQPHWWLRTTVTESAYYSCRGPDPSNHIWRLSSKRSNTHPWTPQKLTFISFPKILSGCSLLYILIDV